MLTCHKREPQVQYKRLANPCLDLQSHFNVFRCDWTLIAAGCMRAPVYWTLIAAVEDFYSA